MKFYTNFLLIDNGMACFSLILVIETILFIFTREIILVYIFFSFLFICFVSLFFLRELIFSKTQIDDLGIKIIYNRKLLKELKWNDIVRIERSLDNLGNSLLFYDSNIDLIKFNITRKKWSKLLNYVQLII